MDVVELQERHAQRGCNRSPGGGLAGAGGAHDAEARAVGRALLCFGVGGVRHASTHLRNGDNCHSRHHQHGAQDNPRGEPLHPSQEYPGQG